MDIINQHYWNRYNKFIDHCRNKTFDEGERHHIVPRCFGGSDDSNNIVFLGYREHYIAHYMLTKALGGKLWFAFTMMQRICKGKSVLYGLSRKYVSEQVRMSNTGRKRSAENRKRMSDRRKGTVVVKDSNGNIFRTSIHDPDYISGKLVYYRVGTKHKKSTREKISNNGIKGRKVYHDPTSQKSIFISDGEKVPDGYVQGAN